MEGSGHGLVSCNSSTCHDRLTKIHKYKTAQSYCGQNANHTSPICYRQLTPSAQCCHNHQIITLFHEKCNMTSINGPNASHTHTHTPSKYWSVKMIQQRTRWKVEVSLHKNHAQYETSLCSPTSCWNVWKNKEKEQVFLLLEEWVDMEWHTVLKYLLLEACLIFLYCMQ